MSRLLLAVVMVVAVAACVAARSPPGLDVAARGRVELPSVSVHLGSHLVALTAGDAYAPPLNCLCESEWLLDGQLMRGCAPPDQNGRSWCAAKAHHGCNATAFDHTRGLWWNPCGRATESGRQLPGAAVAPAAGPKVDEDAPFPGAIPREVRHVRQADAQDCGTVPDTCPSGYEIFEYDIFGAPIAAACFESCKTDEEPVYLFGSLIRLPGCLKSCKSGFVPYSVDPTGLNLVAAYFCVYDGPLVWAHSSQVMLPHDPICGPDEYQAGLLCYKICDPGYHNNLLGRCIENCREGYYDWYDIFSGKYLCCLFLDCYDQANYATAVAATRQYCPAAHPQYGTFGLCYDSCPSDMPDFDGTSICYGRCPEGYFPPVAHLCAKNLAYDLRLRDAPSQPAGCRSDLVLEYTLLIPRCFRPCPALGLPTIADLRATQQMLTDVFNALATGACPQCSAGDYLNFLPCSLRGNEVLAPLESAAAAMVHLFSSLPILPSAEKTRILSLLPRGPACKVSAQGAAPATAVPDASCSVLAEQGSCCEGKVVGLATRPGCSADDAHALKHALQICEVVITAIEAVVTTVTGLLRIEAVKVDVVLNLLETGSLASTVLGVIEGAVALFRQGFSLGMRGAEFDFHLRCGIDGTLDRVANSGPEELLRNATSGEKVLLLVGHNAAPFLRAAPPLASLPANASYECAAPDPVQGVCDEACGGGSLQVSVDNVVLPLGGGRGLLERTYSCADPCGLVTRYVQGITLEHTLPPSYIGTTPDERTVADVCGPAPYPAGQQFEDECGSHLGVGEQWTADEVPNTRTCAYRFDEIQTVTATDVAGRTGRHSFLVHHTWACAPSLHGLPPDETVDYRQPPTPFTVTATDCCGSALQVDVRTVTVPEAPSNRLNCFPGYSVTRCFNATDDCGLEVAACRTVRVRSLCGDDGPDGSELATDLLRVPDALRPVSFNGRGEFASAFSPDQASYDPENRLLCVDLGSGRCGAVNVPAGRGGAEVADHPPPPGRAECMYRPAVGAELWYDRPFKYGSITFVAQPEAVSGVISSVFTMHGVNAAQEPVHQLILSFAGNSTRQLVTNIIVWPQGGGHGPVEFPQYVDIPFDWSADSNCYRIVWTETAVEWWTGTLLLRRVVAGATDEPVPSTDGRVFVHSWAISNSQLVSGFRHLSGAFDPESVRERPHHFCLSCFYYTPADASACANGGSAPPAGLKVALTGATSAKAPATANSPRTRLLPVPAAATSEACPSAPVVGISAFPPIVNLWYDGQSQAVYLDVDAPYYPNGRVLLAFAKRPEYAKMLVCDGREGDLATEPDVCMLTLDEVAALVPGAEDTCLVPRWPWRVSVGDHCHLRYRARIPFDALFTACGAALPPLLAGDRALFSGNVLTATLWDAPAPPAAPKAGSKAAPRPYAAKKPDSYTACGRVDFEGVGWADGAPVDGPVAAGAAGVNVSFAVRPAGGGEAAAARLARVGAPTTAFEREDGHTGTQVFRRAGGAFLTDAGPAVASDYLLEFSEPVYQVELDLYDFRGDGGALPGDTARLVLFAGAGQQGAELASTTFTLPSCAPACMPHENVQLLVAKVDDGDEADGALSAALFFSGAGDAGTGVDNVRVCRRVAGLPPPANHTASPCPARAVFTVTPFTFGIQSLIEQALFNAEVAAGTAAGGGASKERARLAGAAAQSASSTDAPPVSVTLSMTRENDYPVLRLTVAAAPGADVTDVTYLGGSGAAEETALALESSGAGQWTFVGSQGQLSSSGPGTDFSFAVTVAGSEGHPSVVQASVAVQAEPGLNVRVVGGASTEASSAPPALSTAMVAALVGTLVGVAALVAAGPRAYRALVRRSRLRRQMAQMDRKAASKAERASKAMAEAEAAETTTVECVGPDFDVATLSAVRDKYAIITSTEAP